MARIGIEMILAYSPEERGARSARSAPSGTPAAGVGRGRAGFEDACEELGVSLHVLPPRRPQYNGCVERANRSRPDRVLKPLRRSLTVADVAASLSRYEF